MRMVAGTSRSVIVTLWTSWWTFAMMRATPAASMAGAAGALCPLSVVSVVLGHDGCVFKQVQAGKVGRGHPFCRRPQG